VKLLRCFKFVFRGFSRIDVEFHTIKHDIFVKHTLFKQTNTLNCVQIHEIIISHGEIMSSDKFNNHIQFTLDEQINNKINFLNFTVSLLI